MSISANESCSNMDDSGKCLSSTRTDQLPEKDNRKDVAYSAYLQKNGNIVKAATSSGGNMIDMIFVLDTSGSMSDEASSLCSKIYEIENTLRNDYGIDANYRIYGIYHIATDGFSGATCMDGYIDQIFSATLINDNEDWGPATAIVSQQYPWRYGATRVIIPISDEAPEDGESCYDPGSDREAISFAISVASSNNVMVFPIMATGQTQCGIYLAADLASATGGVVQDSTAIGTEMARNIREHLYWIETDKYRLLIIPMNWEGSYDSFSQRADELASYYLERIPLNDCRYKFEVVKSGNVDYGENWHGWFCDYPKIIDGYSEYDCSE
ncbi:MAG: hypothetical protein HZB67_04960 [Candidatus Aenigmarchaeota archaeon]|nr:hypothetical protein [Candidatus Aenigmarchaeota archaeon]